MNIGGGVMFPVKQRGGAHVPRCNTGGCRVLLGARPYVLRDDCQAWHQAALSFPQHKWYFALMKQVSFVSCNHDYLTQRCDIYVFLSTFGSLMHEACGKLKASFYGWVSQDEQLVTWVSTLGISALSLTEQVISVRFHITGQSVRTRTAPLSHCITLVACCKRNSDKIC